MIIPDEAVKAAVEAIHRYDMETQLSTIYAPNEHHRAEARAALESATPILLAAAASEVRANHDHIVEGGDGYSAGFHYALTVISGGAS